MRRQTPSSGDRDCVSFHIHFSRSLVSTYLSPNGSFSRSIAQGAESFSLALDGDEKKVSNPSTSQPPLLFIISHFRLISVLLHEKVKFWMWKLGFVGGAARQEYWFCQGACGVGEAVTSPFFSDVQQSGLFRALAPVCGA